MVADKNFKWNGTLAEANEIRVALEERHGRLTNPGEGLPPGHPVSLMDLTEQERESIGRIEKLLRIDF
jgi:hypothetical protein